ncbi:putative Ig domain-containing protein [Thermomonospora umbrina]|uniref:Streptogrisin C n=1 Tax=Thermomonospora umbrina TaxID=111806 RepID=A0A3D9STI8_9ACTN|nr:putative Ig domain-containing protein [Thermomonospora umbrina]REE95021.1 streptogrisin C [Thermomonospora umbrina]
MNRYARLLCSTGTTAATLAALALAALPAANARTAPADTDPVLHAMQRDLGLSADQVRRRWTQEAQARQAARSLRPAVGNAGMWFDGGQGTLVVPVTDDANARNVRALGAQPLRVRYGPAALSRTAAAVSRLVGDGTPGVTSWGTDPARDRVIVQVTSAVAPSTEARLRALSPSVTLVRSDTVFRRQGGDVTGGEYWKPGSEGSCSIGFSATGTGGTRHMLTAGHCTNDVDQPAYGKDGTRLGTSNTGGTHSVNTREGDFGLVDVTQTAWRLTPTVSGWGQGDITVTGSAEPTVGMSICHSGGNTELRCGTVTRTNQSIDYGNVIIDGLFITNACSGAGDSGGSYVTGPTSDAKAVGIHSGGGNACGQTGPTTIAQPVNEATTKWRLTLVTGDPQPGDLTVTAPGDQSGQTGTAVRLTNQVNGGTAPYTWTATGLPAGLTIDPTSGTITGTPSTAGSTRVTVTATDARNKTGSASFTWTITTTGAAPSVTSPGAQTAYVGRPFQLPLNATGGATPYRWKATGLPAGLTIDAATGRITGTPTRWGMSTATATVTDQAGRTASVTFLVTVWNPW